MQHSFRKAGAALLAAGLLVSLTACGGSGSQTEEADETFPEVVIVEQDDGSADASAAAEEETEPAEAEEETADTKAEEEAAETEEPEETDENEEAEEPAEAEETSEGEGDRPETFSDWQAACAWLLEQPDRITALDTEGLLPTDTAFSRGFLYDLDGDGSPELFLEDTDTGLRALVGWAGTEPVLLGAGSYDALGIIRPELLTDESAGDGTEAWRVWLLADGTLTCSDVFGWDGYSFTVTRQNGSDCDESLSVSQYADLYESMVSRTVPLDSFTWKDLTDPALVSDGPVESVEWTAGEGGLTRWTTCYITGVDVAAWFRSAPAEDDSNILRSISKGSAVIFLETVDDTFSKVIYGSRTGYVKTKFLWAEE